MAFFRLFSTSAAGTVGEPTDITTPGDLLDYEFENSLTDSSAPTQALTSIPTANTTFS